MEVFAQEREEKEDTLEFERISLDFKKTDAQFRGGAGEGAAGMRCGWGGLALARLLLDKQRTYSR